MDLDPQAVLHAYLDRQRDAMVRAVAGLDDYDVRRPLTPTGTNLLGLVKHLTGVELEYFGLCCGRPSPLMADGSAEGPVDDEDMWVRPDESTASVLERYAGAREHADATIRALALDSPAHVPWWPEDRRDTTLQVLLVHVVAETARHAGHADIVRELVDGSAGVDPSYDWVAHRARVEAAAREVSGRVPDAGS